MKKQANIGKTAAQPKAVSATRKPSVKNLKSEDEDDDLDIPEDEEDDEDDDFNDDDSLDAGFQDNFKGFDDDEDDEDDDF